MANTTTRTGRFITITGLDDDWWGNVALGAAVELLAVQFVPSAASDRMIIRNGGLDNAVIFDSGVTANTNPLRVDMPGSQYCNPVIDISDCTLSTAANAKVMLLVSKIGNDNIN